MSASVCINSFLGLVMLCHSVSAATIQCPQIIQTKQSLQQEINKWNVLVDNWNNDHRFERIAFYSGHPKEHASLAPDNETSQIKKLTWTFGKQETWVACEYTHTKIQLIQKLPAEIKRCTVTYNADFSKVVAINCI